MFNVSEFARMVGVHRNTVSIACVRGEIPGAERTSGDVQGKGTGKRRGHWRIPEDTKWRPGVGRTVDASDFDAGTVDTTVRSRRADADDLKALESFLREHATPEQAEAAREWMRDNNRRLPQLRRDPILERADREHPLLG